MKTLTRTDLPWKCDGSKEVLFEGELYQVPELAQMIHITDRSVLRYAYIDKEGAHAFALQPHPYQPLESLPDDFEGWAIVVECDKDNSCVLRDYIYIQDKKDVIDEALCDHANIFYYIPPKAPGEA